MSTLRLRFAPVARRAGRVWPGAVRIARTSRASSHRCCPDAVESAPGLSVERGCQGNRVGSVRPANGWPGRERAAPPAVGRGREFGPASRASAKKGSEELCQTQQSSPSTTSQHPQHPQRRLNGDPHTYKVTPGSITDAPHPRRQRMGRRRPGNPGCAAPANHSAIDAIDVALHHATDPDLTDQRGTACPRC